MKRIVFAAGGTGGHVYPALAIADELKKLDKSIGICFIGAKGKMEERLVPEYGYELRTINIRGLSRKVTPENLITAFKVFSSLREARTILRTYAPDIVFGTGGYVSGPVIWAAKGLKKRTVLYEGNYLPGLTVRLLASKADRILVNFAGTAGYFKNNDKVKVFPYPVRKNLVKVPRQQASDFFGLDSNKKTLFVFGGSQGAHSINVALLKNANMLTEQAIQIIWQTGEKDYDLISESMKNNTSVKAYPYIGNINFAYSASDLIVCRSGISAIMELACFGAAAIFVPYPFSTDSHQIKNAERLAEMNAAFLIDDKDLESGLTQKIIALLSNDTLLEAVRVNIKKFCDKDGAAKIADYLHDFTEMKN